MLETCLELSCTRLLLFSSLTRSLSSNGVVGSGVLAGGCHHVWFSWKFDTKVNRRSGLGLNTQCPDV
jgi:hypothetical protein